LKKEILQKYLTAGEIAKKCKEFALKEAKVGARLLDVAEGVEGLIKKEGGGPAFPVNISINEIAAHFTPDGDCDFVFKDDDLVKIDIGVHVDGYIADTAVTLSMNGCEEHVKLIKAAEDALSAGIKAVKVGEDFGVIGKAVENVITAAGFEPIRNLTGHGLEQYSLHAGLTIPNVDRNVGVKIEEGMAFAIEPFSTNGAGMVVNKNGLHIYEFLREVGVRSRDARRILMLAQRDYARLPFARRWVEGGIKGMKLDMALKELAQKKAIYQYPVLRDKANGLVAQAEDTIVITDEGEVVVTT